MNNRLKGFYRDKEIVELVNKCRCLSAEQIELLVFPYMKSGKRKCQMRLKKLTDNRTLKRWRYDLAEPYAYYVDINKPVEQMEHTISLNWLYLHTLRQMPAGYWLLMHQEYHPQYFKQLKPDMLLGFKNKWSGEYKFYFLEMERGFNEYEKPLLYNNLFEYWNGPLFKNLWWTDLMVPKKFPKVLIGVSVSSHKAYVKYEEALKIQNKNNLNIEIVNIANIRRGD